MIQLVFALAIVLAVLYCGFKLRAFVVGCWIIKQLWWWHSGHALSGKHITNAGWWRKGYGPPNTPTGHCWSWWYRPRWQRAAHRTGGTYGTVALVYGLLADTVLTLASTGAGLLALAGWLAWKIRGAWRDRQQRRTWLHPLHLAAHELAGHPKAIKASSWITTTLDADGAVTAAELKLPAGFPADEQDKKRLVSMASQKLGIESPEPSWRLAGPTPLLRLMHSPPPPSHVDMETLLPELEKCRRDELVIGVGKNEELIKVSLASDSPHLAISMGTGAGKSNLAGWILLQFLLRDGIGLVLDPKDRLSYPWILKDEDGEYDPLPNVAYAWTLAQLHACMEWLSTERKRRGDVAFSGVNARGKIRANVGAELCAVVEELNVVAPQLRAHWQQNRGPGDPAKSPAFTGLGDLTFAGRQVFMRGILIGQCITAEVTGSRDSSVKEQCGVKMLARYGPKGWRMMAEDIPMPASPDVTGRVQVIAPGEVKLTQTPQMDGVLARELVLASDMALLPHDMPCKPRQPATVAAGQIADTGSGQGGQPIQPPVVASLPELGTFRDALRQGVLHPATTLSSLEMGRHRDPGFPAHREVRGKAFAYDLGELAAWDAARRSA